MRDAAAGGRGSRSGSGSGAAGAKRKTRTPHSDVGEKTPRTGLIFFRLKNMQTCIW